MAISNALRPWRYLIRLRSLLVHPVEKTHFSDGKQPDQQTMSPKPPPSNFNSAITLYRIQTSAISEKSCVDRKGVSPCIAAATTATRMIRRRSTCAFRDDIVHQVSSGSGENQS
jgi:hypothetical protein